jgi:hypothetical protein
MASTADCTRCCHEIWTTVNWRNTNTESVCFVEG